METNRRIVWRLPVRVASEMEGNWDPFRDVLSRWAETGEQLDPALDETKPVGISVPEETLQALEREAKRLTKLTKQKWTAGRVARLVWENYA
jgi:hypothetical protein